MFIKRSGSRENFPLNQVPFSSFRDKWFLMMNYFTGANLNQDLDDEGGGRGLNVF